MPSSVRRAERAPLGQLTSGSGCQLSGPLPTRNRIRIPRPSPSSRTSSDSGVLGVHGQRRAVRRPHQVRLEADTGTPAEVEEVVLAGSVGPEGQHRQAQLPSVAGRGRRLGEQHGEPAPRRRPSDGEHRRRGRPAPARAPSGTRRPVQVRPVAVDRVGTRGRRRRGHQERQLRAVRGPRHGSHGLDSVQGHGRHVSGRGVHEPERAAADPGRREAASVGCPGDLRAPRAGKPVLGAGVRLGDQDAAVQHRDLVAVRRPGRRGAVVEHRRVDAARGPQVRLSHAEQGAVSTRRAGRCGAGRARGCRRTGMARRAAHLVGGRSVEDGDHGHRSRRDGHHHRQPSPTPGPLERGQHLERRQVLDHAGAQVLGCLPAPLVETHRSSSCSIPSWSATVWRPRCRCTLADPSLIPRVRAMSATSRP